MHAWVNTGSAARGVPSSRQTATDRRVATPVCSIEHAIEHSMGNSIEHPICIFALSNNPAPPLASLLGCPSRSATPPPSTSSTSHRSVPSRFRRSGYQNFVIVPIPFICSNTRHLTANRPPFVSFYQSICVGFRQAIRQHPARRSKLLAVALLQLSMATRASISRRGCFPQLACSK